MAGVSDEAVESATGRTRTEWFKLLDKWGATERGHAEIAAHLASRHKVDGWWAQTLTVDYERARGLRAVGQRPGGAFEASLQRTIPCDPDLAETLLLAGGKLLHPALAGEPRVSDTRQGRVLRYRHGEDRVEVVLSPKDAGRCVVHITHGGLPNAKARDAAKAAWADAMATLRARLA